MKELIGKRISALKGMKREKRTTKIPIDFILFDDGESYLELNEQDYYTYHDCSSFAREIYLRKDKRMWNLVMSGAPDSRGNNFYLESTENTVNILGLIG